jgi:hypothetical protein
VLNLDGVTNLALNDVSIDCYYFCVASYNSTIVARGGTVTANHAQDWNDGHSIFWTHISNQKYINSTLKFTTGKALFSGCNIFTTHQLEMAGDTAVTGTHPIAWVVQNIHYNGLSLRLRGSYPTLDHWLFDLWPSGVNTWSQYASICYVPSSGPEVCDTQLHTVPTYCPQA